LKWICFLSSRSMPAPGPVTSSLFAGALRRVVVGHQSSQVKLILSPKQRAKPKTSARKTGKSMPHCVAR
jgi:hypothetical protein